jgi:hypothetical protein
MTLDAMPHQPADGRVRRSRPPWSASARRAGVGAKAAFDPDAICASMCSSLSAARRISTPYPHWFLRDCLPQDVVAGILDLPFLVPDLGGLSGTREIHNSTRTYFDAASMVRFAVCDALNSAFLSAALTDRIAAYFEIDLRGSLLRVEYAQDTDGFWLAPHTDLGAKLFSLLVYISSDPRHHNLGTDIYDANRLHVGRALFQQNAALAFVPSSNTFHGFEPRVIRGVRKSIIINYVTSDWRCREQLACPEGQRRGARETRQWKTDSC